MDRDPRARGEPTVLVRVAVDGVFDEVRADSAVVQQRVALTRGAVADHALARGPIVQQQPQQAVAEILGTPLQRHITADVVQVGAFLGGEQFGHPGRGCAGHCVGPGPQPDRAAVCRKGFDVDDGQPGGRERTGRRRDRVVLEMLVVDGVELRELDQVARVVHLDGQPPVVGEQRAQGAGEAQQVGDVGIDVVGHHEVRGPVPVPNRRCY